MPAALNSPTSVLKVKKLWRGTMFKEKKKLNLECGKIELLDVCNK